MIYHGEGSTKTISKPDTLTSDFKKFPSNLFDLWKCVQVHREWFQIYHILVRIINDFQFVNLMLPCSRELRGITNGWYQSPSFCSWKHDYFIKILLPMTYISLIFHSRRAVSPPSPSFLSPHVRVPHAFFKKKKNTTPSKHQSSRGSCHCLANLLKLDVALLVPSSWHMHF